MRASTEAFDVGQCVQGICVQIVCSHSDTLTYTGNQSQHALAPHDITHTPRGARESLVCVENGKNGATGGLCQSPLPAKVCSGF